MMKSTEKTSFSPAELTSEVTVKEAPTANSVSNISCQNEDKNSTLKGVKNMEKAENAAMKKSVREHKEEILKRRLSLLQNKLITSHRIKEKPFALQGENTSKGIRAERMDLATEKSRHFLRTDGTVCAVFTPFAMNRKNKSGDWETIPNTLIATDRGYEADFGRYHASFSSCANVDFCAEREDVRMEWTYASERALPPSRISTENNFNTSAGIGSRILYENVEKNVDVEYILLGEQMKENILVRAPGGDYTYPFRICTRNLSLSLSEDEREIYIYSADGERTTPEFIIPAPCMFDAKGVWSEKVHYTLKQNDDEALLTVVADAEFMNDPARVYPVTVDPQLIAPNSSSTVEVFELVSGYSEWKDSTCENIRIFSGTEGTAYKTEVTFSKPSVKSFQDRIISAKVLLTPVVECESGYVKVNEEETYYPGGTFEIDILEYLNSEEIDFTLELAPSVYRADTYDRQFFADGVSAPCIVIEYLASAEVKPTQESVTLPGDATANIDVFSGETIVSFTDVSSTFSVFGTEISHSYRCGVSRYETGDFLLNLHAHLEKNSDENLNARYIYTDASGKKHGLVPRYYYWDSNRNRKEVLGDLVTVQPDGTLRYHDREVFREELLYNGWRAKTKLTDGKSLALFDQRSEEEAELEEQLNGLQLFLEDYMFLERQTENGEEKIQLGNHCFDDMAISWRAYENFEFEGSLYLQTNSAIAYRKYYEEERQALDEESRLQLDRAWENTLAQSKAQFKNSFLNYLRLEDKLKKLQKEQPEVYLTNGTYHYGFNRSGDLVAIFDVNENYSLIERDSKNRIVRIYDNSGNQISFHYYSSGRLSSITDTRGAVIRYNYNMKSQLEKVEKPDGTTLSFEYNGKYLIGVYTENEKATLSYNALRLTAITQESNVSQIKDGVVSCNEAYQPITTLQLAYTDNANEISTLLTDHQGDRRMYLFSEEGALAEYRAERGGVVVQAEQYEYTEDGQLSDTYSLRESLLYNCSLDDFNFSDFGYLDQIFYCENDPALPEEILHYYLQTTDDPAYKDTSTVITYDENGRAILEKCTVSANDGTELYVRITRFFYDACGRKYRTESYIQGEEASTGIQVEETVYGEQGEAKSIRSYNSLAATSVFCTEKEYGEHGNVQAQMDETGRHQTTFTYLDGKLPLTATVPNGSIMAYNYDSEGRVISVSQSTKEGVENSIHRNYTSKLLTKLESNSHTVLYEYDEKNRKTKVIVDGVPTLFSYSERTAEGNSESVTVTDAAGNAVKTTVDAHGKILRKDVNNGLQYAVQYNTKQLPTLAQDIVEAKNATYTYDDFDRLTRYEDLPSGGNITSISVRETYNYNANGFVSAETLSMGDYGSTTLAYTYQDDAKKELASVQVNGCTVHLKRDALGRNIGKSIHNDGIEYIGERISYMQHGDRTTMLPAHISYGALSPYGFFYMDHLTYEYDCMGNVSAVRENDVLTVRYFYDALNRLVREDNKKLSQTKVYTYDETGNIISKRTYDFTLCEMKELETLPYTRTLYCYSGDRLQNYNDTFCFYNSDGRCNTYCGKTVSWNANGMLSYYDAHSFTYNGKNQLSAENGNVLTYDRKGRLCRHHNGLRFFYINGELAGCIDGANTYFYRRDGLGNITALLDNYGNVVVNYVYDAWGNHKVMEFGTERTDPDFIGNKNPFRYKGYYYSTSTGLYYLKSRFYDPVVGRFISPDRVEFLNPDSVNGINLYTYCGNNPVMNVDPMGTFFLLGVILMAAGALVGAGAVAYEDYQDDGEIFNGSVSVSDYLVAALLGAAIGGSIALASLGIGTALGAGSTLGPGIAIASSGGAVTTSVGVQAAGAVGVLGIGLLAYERKKAAPRIKSSSKKKAYDKAFHKGGKKTPIYHPNGKFGPHFHPFNPKFKHWHYYFSLILLLLGQEEFYEEE